MAEQVLALKPADELLRSGIGLFRLKNSGLQEVIRRYGSMQAGLTAIGNTMMVAAASKNAHGAGRVRTPLRQWDYGSTL